MTEQFFWQICKEMDDKINSIFDRTFHIKTWEFENKSGLACCFEGELFFNQI